MAPSSLFLVTGGAGFIGSHIVERLLGEGHRVRVLDNFSTGSRANLDFARGNRRLEIIRGELANLKTVERAVRGVTAIFHQAAMRSVPRSVADPLGANASNVTGTLHVLHAAARQKKKPRVVYASSSSVYGDRPDLPKREDQPTAPISPYAATKVHGDGTQSRDFTYIDNVVSANLLAARAEASRASGKSYNVGCGSRTSLLEIIAKLETMLGRPFTRRHSPTRAGDVPHTLADVSAAKRDLGYEPVVEFDEGLRRTVEFFTGRKLG